MKMPIETLTRTLVLRYINRVLECHKKTENTILFHLRKLVYNNNTVND